MAVKINNTTVIDDSRNATFLGLESATLPLLVSGQFIAHKAGTATLSNGVYEVDCTSGNFFSITPTANFSLRLINSPIGAYSSTLSINNTTLSAITISWPTSAVGAPTSIAASSTTIINFFTVNGGELWTTSLASYT